MTKVDIISGFLESRENDLYKRADFEGLQR